MLNEKRVIFFACWDDSDDFFPVSGDGGFIFCEEGGGRIGGHGWRLAGTV